MSVMTFLMISMVPNSPQSKRGLPRVFREQCCTPGASVGAQIRSCGSDRVLYRYPLSTTLEFGADVTVENEATGSSCS
jgi:hypothetical protein